ncbi:MAG: phenylalanine--tRNA ligase subunit alpha, partial [Leifsonia sp.]
MSETSEISEASVEAAVASALAAIDAAADSAALKVVRAEHTAEGSPLARLNAAIRSVPNDQKAAAGKLVGQARGTVTQAFAAKEAQIEREENEARLAEEAL